MGEAGSADPFSKGCKKSTFSGFRSVCVKLIECMCASASKQLDAIHEICASEKKLPALARLPPLLLPAPPLAPLAPAVSLSERASFSALYSDGPILLNARQK